MPYTLAVYMVREFLDRDSQGHVKEEKVGELTGLLAACFCAAQFLTSWPWGRASDRLGRKPLLIMSNISSCISVICFGLSSNFTMAAIFRLLGGLFNCTFVCLKSMIGESCDIQSQARPLSYLSLCWGLGTVVGPSLGGALSRPCRFFGDGFPFCQDNQILQRRPFLLPCLAVGLVSFIAALSSIFLVVETLPALVAKKYQMVPVSEVDEDLEAKNTISHLTETELVHLASIDPLARGNSEVSNDEEAQELSLVAHSSEEESAGPPGFLSRSDTASHLCSQLKSDRKYRNLSNDSTSQGNEEASRLEEEDLARQFKKIEAEKELGIVWYKDLQILLVISGYVSVCLLYNLLDEVTPIYSSADRSEGGLQLTTSQLAVPLAAGGVSIFMYQKYFGVLNACRLACLMTIPLAVALAVPSLLPISAVGMQIALACVLFIKNICATNAFTSAVIMVNTVAPQKDLGAVNGASQASASFVRAVGPALGGVMWGLSVSTPFRGHQIIPFGITAVGFTTPLIIFSSLRSPQINAS